MSAESTTPPSDGSVYGSMAQVYRAEGWKGVLPLGVREKVAPPGGFTGYGAPDPDDAQVHEWGLVRYKSNIALRLPPGLIGIDVDDYAGKQGSNNLTLLAEEFSLGPLPPTWMSTSRGWQGQLGSGIYLYRVPLGVIFPDILCADVDVVQHHHRYVVAPPSVHPGDKYTPPGGIYWWYRPDGSPAAPGEVPRPDLDIPELPSEWVAALRLDGERMKGRPAAGSVGPTYSRREIDVVIAAADEHWASVPRGSVAGKLEAIYRRFREDALASNRRAAMVRATAITAQDVVEGTLPGSAILDLYEVVAQAYYNGLGHKVPKDFAREKEWDFWSLVGGALGRYMHGDWAEDLAVRRAALEAVDALRLAPVEPGEVLPPPPQLPSAPAPQEPVVQEAPPEAAPPAPVPVPMAEEVMSAEELAEIFSVPAVDPESGFEVPSEVMDWISTLGEELPGLEVVDAPPLPGLDIPAAEVPPEVAAGLAVAVEAAQEAGLSHRVISPSDPRLRDAFLRLLRREMEVHAEDLRWAAVAAVDGLPVTEEALRKAKEFTLEDVRRVVQEAVQMVETLEGLRRPGDFAPEVLPHVVWQDWLPEGTVATLIAGPGVGKTVVAVDLAARVAMGWQWMGVPVSRCPVLFLSYEAAVSTENRIAAWAQFHELDSVPWLYQSGVAAPLSSEAGLMMVETMLSGVRVDLGVDVGLMVVDTLAASFGSGNENDVKDMNAVLDNIKRIQAQYPRLAVLILHHPVKEASIYEFQSGRGSGALRGTAQVEMAVARVKDVDTHIRVGRTKTRDGSLSASHRLVLRSWDLRGEDGALLRNPWGAPMSAVVADSPSDSEVLEAEGKTLHIRAEDAVELAGAIAVVIRGFTPGEKVTQEVVRQACLEAGVKLPGKNEWQAVTKDVIAALLETGELFRDGRSVWRNRPGEDGE